MRAQAGKTDSMTARATGAQGRFPHNDIISLLDVNRRLNLAESTTRDLTFGELIDTIGLDALRDVQLGYGRSQGEQRFRDAIAKRTGVSADIVVTTQGCALGIALLALELCGAGREALLFGPCFPPSRDVLTGLGTSFREIALTFEGRFAVDLDRFADSLTPNISLVSIASPQNPSGVVTSLETLSKMLAIMASKAPRAHLFVDETYLDATYGAESLLSAASLDSRVIVGGSISKAHGAPGLRAGWLTVPDPTLRSCLTTAKMNLVISGSPLNETIAAILLERTELQLARNHFLGEAFARLAMWVESNSEFVAWVRPHAGALCMMQIQPELFDENAVQEFWKVLPQYDLQLAPGTWFGASLREFRLGFGYLPLGELDAALSALSSVLKQTAGSVSPALAG